MPGWSQLPEHIPNAFVSAVVDCLTTLEADLDAERSLTLDTFVRVASSVNHFSCGRALKVLKEYWQGHGPEQEQGVQLRSFLFLPRLRVLWCRDWWEKGRLLW